MHFKRHSYVRKKQVRKEKVMLALIKKIAEMALLISAK